MEFVLVINPKSTLFGLIGRVVSLDAQSVKVSFEENPFNALVNRPMRFMRHEVELA